jgi:hypothetical protein
MATNAYVDMNREGSGSFKIDSLTLQGNQITNCTFKTDGQVADIYHWANVPDGFAAVTTVTKTIDVEGYLYPSQIMFDAGDNVLHTFEVSVENGLKITGNCKILNSNESLKVREMGTFSISMRCFNVVRSTNGGEYYT